MKTKNKKQPRTNAGTCRVTEEEVKRSELEMLFLAASNLSKRLQMSAESSPDKPRECYEWEINPPKQAWEKTRKQKSARVATGKAVEVAPKKILDGGK